MFVPGLDWITNAAIPSEARPLLQRQFLDPTPLAPSQVATKGEGVRTAGVELREVFREVFPRNFDTWLIFMVFMVSATASMVSLHANHLPYCPLPVRSDHGHLGYHIKYTTHPVSLTPPPRHHVLLSCARCRP